VTVCNCWHNTLDREGLTGNEFQTVGPGTENARWLSVCPLDYSQSYKQISMKVFGGVGHEPRTSRLDFSGDPDHDDSAPVTFKAHIEDCTKSFLFARWQY